MIVKCYAPSPVAQDQRLPGNSTEPRMRYSISNIVANVKPHFEGRNGAFERHPSRRHGATSRQCGVDAASIVLEYVGSLLVRQPIDAFDEGHEVIEPIAGFSIT